MSRLERLPRELRAKIYKHLIAVTTGSIPLLALPGNDNIQGYSIILNKLQETQVATIKPALDAYTVLRNVNSQFGDEVREDFFYLNKVHITLSGRSFLGNGPPLGGQVPHNAMISIKNIIITAARLAGPWAATSGGPALTVAIETSKSAQDDFRCLHSATAMGSDKQSQDIADFVSEHAGLSLDQGMIIGLMTLLECYTNTM